MLRGVGDTLIPASNAYAHALEDSAAAGPNASITLEEFDALKESGVSADRILANMREDLFTQWTVFDAKTRTSATVGGAMAAMRKRPGSRLFG